MLSNDIVETFNLSLLYPWVRLTLLLGAIQVIRNAVGGGSICQKTSVTKVYDPTLLALRGVGGGQISRKKR